MPCSTVSIVPLCSLCLEVHVFAWLLTVNTMAKTSEARALGMFTRAESLEMEQRYECWSVKGTTAASPLLAIAHKQHLATSHRTVRTSHLHSAQECMCKSKTSVKFRLTFEYLGHKITVDYTLATVSVFSRWKVQCLMNRSDPLPWQRPNLLI